ncbi:MAG: hypothetical protein FJW23_09020 [Acidimicrobiia bacterium]|nr:hypothetical protein [Acidimicrobiia bacterium]
MPSPPRTRSSDRVTLVLCAVLAIEIVVVAFACRNWGGGDASDHTANAYLAARGHVPFVDYHIGQGITLVHAMALWVRIAGPTLASTIAFMTLCTLLAAALLLVIARQVLRAGGVDVTSGIVPLLVLLVCSPYFWWFLSGVDSKSSLALLLLLAAAASASRVEDRPEAAIRWCVAGGTAFGLLVTTKYTFASLAPCFAAYLAVRGRPSRAVALASFALAAAATVLIAYAPVVRAAGWQAGAALVWQSFDALRIEYAMRDQSLREGLFRTGQAAQSWVLLTAGAIPFLAALASTPRDGRPARPEPGTPTLLMACGAVYLLANMAALFPSVLFAHYAITAPLLAVPVALRAALRQPAMLYGRRRLAGLALVACCAAIPQSALAVGERITGLKIWSPQGRYAVLGRNDMVGTLDRLAASGLPSGEPATAFLYVGRMSYALLRSELPLSTWANYGTVYLEAWDVDHDMANRVRVIALSNFPDLLRLHNVVVLEPARMDTERAIRQLQDMRRMLAAARFDRIERDDYHELYVRTGSAPPPRAGRPGDAGSRQEIAVFVPARVTRDRSSA